MKGNATVAHANEFNSNSKNGPKIPKKSVRGWEFLVRWKDGSYSWLKCKTMKTFNVGQFGENAKERQKMSQISYTGLL